MVVEMNGELAIVSRKIGVEQIKEASHTGPVLAAKIDKLCNKWGLNKTGGVGVIATTD